MRDIFSNRQELYLDPNHKKLGGVCAGVANYLDISTFWIRLAAVIGLVVHPLGALAAYGLAYIILDEQPDDYDGVV